MRTEERLRRLRGSGDVQTGQSQSLSGTPMEVPVPKKSSSNRNALLFAEEFPNAWCWRKTLSPPEYIALPFRWGSIDASFRPLRPAYHVRNPLTAGSGSRADRGDGRDTQAG